MTVDGQDSGTTVIRLLSIGRRRNKENVQLSRALPATELSRATASAEPPEHRQTLQDLTNRTSKVKQMSIIEETQEEDVTAEQDDPMPQLISQSSSIHQEQ